MTGAAILRPRRRVSSVRATPRARRATVVLVLAACVLRGTPAAAHVGSHEVTIKDLEFQPARLSVDPGETVTWHALEGGHTVSADDGGFETGRTLAQGESFAWETPVADARYAYRCRIHSSMRAEVVVGNPPPPPPRPPVPTIRVPQDAPTLEIALGSATRGTHVVLADGHHTVSATAAVPEGVTVRSADGAAAVVEPSKSGLTPVFRLAANDTQLAGFAIRGGKDVTVEVAGSHRFSIVDMTLEASATDHGILVAASRYGSIRQTALSGYRRSAIFVSGCQDCDTVVDAVTVSKSFRGYEQRNAGGTAVLRSGFLDTEAAIVVREPLESADGTLHRGTHVFGNIVERTSTAQPPHPRLSDGRLTLDAGILLAGSWETTAEANVVSGHRYGVLLTGIAGPTHRNRVLRNTVLATRSGLAYDGLGTFDCFTRNDSRSKDDPPVEEVLYSCDAPATVGVPNPFVIADVVISRSDG